VSAQAGWYPDPGGGQGLFRYWDGKAWSAATSPHPSAPPPAQGLVGSASEPGRSTAGSLGNQPYGSLGGQSGGPYGSAQNAGAYAQYQQTQKKRSPIGWWVAGIALVVVIVVVAVIAIRAVTGGGGISGLPTGQGSQDVCPRASTESPTAPGTAPSDGRVHGGPVSYPLLGSPWGAPTGDQRVPFGSDVQEQTVTVEEDYQPGASWVASVLVGELQAGDGFFTPEQGSQIVVKCILGKFYGDNPVNSDVTVNQKATIDGHEAWIVESKLSFDIRGLQTKGELLIVAIVSAGATSGLYYASIPNTRPELVAPARQALKELKVDG
jgi:hypothetical protein